MASPRIVQFKDDEVFAPTEKANRELKAAGTKLSAAELQMLVLIDGFSGVGDIVQRAPTLTRDDVMAALTALSDAKLIVSTKALDEGGDVLGSGFSTIAVPAGFFSGLSLESSPEAEGGAAILKKKGYYVRIARFPATQREADEKWRPTILVVDDDPDIQKLIRTFLAMEGWKVRMATKRDEIMIGLRQQPLPDLILLDVQLPDANGFEILARLRQHPVLKNVPVIMLTAEATREAVLKGLQGGADGYVTKPFEPDLLVNAAKAVLGLAKAAADPKDKKK